MGKTNDGGGRVELHESLRTHPGEILRHECIRAAGMTVTEAAERLGISRAGLNRLLSGRGRITAAVALRLEALGWSRAEFWLRLQNTFDLAQERRKAA